MQTITSRSNETVKAAAKLFSSADERRRQGLFALEGMRLCRDAFLSGAQIKRVFVTAEALQKYASQLDFLETLQAEVFLITSEIANKLSDVPAPQGVFCICKTLDKRPDIDKIKNNSRSAGSMGAKYLALDRLQDPGNLGAVSRTAEALGLDGLLIGGGCDIYNPKALRASMGALLRLPVFVTEDLPALLRDCAAAGLCAYAAVPDAQAVPVTQIDFYSGAICVIGNEGAGISEQVLDVCAQKITIPMSGRAESLNAAGAAAILIWEMVR